jgi:DNA-binding GntR family transcriptional regulator
VTINHPRSAFSSPPSSASAEISREEQIRAAYVRYYRATAKFEAVPTSSVVRGYHAVWDAVAPWRDLARQRLTKAVGSPADSARWRQLIDALAEPANRTVDKPSFDDLIVLRGTGREFFHALLEAEKPGPTVAEIADRVHRGVKDGRYRPGLRLSRCLVAQECEASTERVALALQDLGDTGVLVVSPSGRARVPSPSDVTVRATEIASWLTTLIELGAYPVGVCLPRSVDLARSLVSATPDVTGALRRLEDSGLLVRRGRRPVVAAEVSPQPLSLRSVINELAALSPVSVTPERVRETAGITHNWWSCRSFPPPGTVHMVFQMMRAMTGRLLTEVRHDPQEQEARSVPLRAAATAIAPWPATSRAQTWRAACPGTALLELLSLVEAGAEADP